MAAAHSSVRLWYGFQKALVDRPLLSLTRQINPDFPTGTRRQRRKAQSRIKVKSTVTRRLQQLFIKGECVALVGTAPEGGGLDSSLVAASAASSAGPAGSG